MGFFSLESKGRLGVDIGTATIKIAELRKASNRFTLTNYGMADLASGQLSNQDIAAGIIEILRAANMTSSDVIASIPSFPTFSTTITLPYLSEAEVAKAMPFEARKYIPVPLTEVQLDWAIVNVNKGSPSSVDVFLVAVPKQEVARYQDIMKRAKLNLRALELENFALIRSLVGNDLSPVVIMNIGGRSTSILIVENGFQRVNRDYEVGGAEITNSIVRTLNMSVERAEELKRNFGIKNSEDNAVRQAMASLVDMIAFEVNKTIHNYEDQQHTKISKILLVGGSAKMPGFVDYFSQKLGRDVSLGNPLARMVLPPALASLQGDLNSHFTVALGLAMREI